VLEVSRAARWQTMTGRAKAAIKETAALAKQGASPPVPRQPRAVESFVEDLVSTSFYSSLYIEEDLVLTRSSIGTCARAQIYTWWRHSCG
jgi:hypothetical protein